MLSESPKPHQEREILLANAPFTKHYLSSPTEDGIDKWNEKYYELDRELEESIYKKLGENWDMLAVMPLLIATDAKMVLDPKATTDQIFVQTKALVLMGYELEDGVEIILPEIGRVLAEDGVFNPKFTKGKAVKKAVNYCDKATKVGAFLKKAVTRLSDEEDKKEDIYGSFLNNLESYKNF
jgi:hypothetical protein